jgi:hypothetical protein
MLCHHLRLRILMQAQLKSAPSQPLFETLNTPHKCAMHAARAVLVSAAAVLLPFLAAADSEVVARAPGTALRAAAHVDFKIIIPRVLSMELASGDDPVPGAHSVAIFSNSHNATLAATVRRADDDQTSPRGTVILSAAARRVIAQNADCTHGVTGPAGRVVCTISMP